MVWLAGYDGVVLRVVVVLPAQPSEVARTVVDCIDHVSAVDCDQIFLYLQVFLHRHDLSIRGTVHEGHFYTKSHRALVVSGTSKSKSLWGPMHRSSVLLSRGTACKLGVFARI